MSKRQDSHEDKSTFGRDFRQMGEKPAVSDDDGKADAADNPKTVRCVIERDFCDRYKKLGSGDFVDIGVGHRSSARREISSELVTRISTLDSSRLKNHLEWKRQKELEYARKKEAEKLEEQRKMQDKLREEKEKKLKEKEREEKVREWQKQKDRKRQEREREETVFKALEQEIKVVTETIGKERMIHEWIRLKNKQKQIEAEKKAELLKKEEESRALRQSLAEISYRQWKEKTKTRKIALPKNGYQIFGPKPIPVVKEDWNHDFIKGDAVDYSAGLRTPKSTVSTTLIRASCGSRTDVCSQPHYQCDLKKRSPSSHHLKMGKSRACAERSSAKPLNCKIALSGAEAPEQWKHNESFVSLCEGDHIRSRKRSDFQWLAGEEKAKCEKATNCYSFHGEKFFFRPPRRSSSNYCASERGNSKIFSDPMMDVLPAKNRLDIYLKTSVSDENLESEAERKLEKPKKTKRKANLEDNSKKFPHGKDAIADDSKLPIEPNGKPASGRSRISNRKIASHVAGNKKGSGSVSGKTGDAKIESVGVREKRCSRSLSCDEPCQKSNSPIDLHRNRSSSKSFGDKSKKAVKAKLPEKQTKKPLGAAAVRNPESRKKKKIHCRKKFSSVNSGDLPERHSKSESETRNRRKTRTGPKSETFLIADSPYTRKRGKNKSNRVKKNEELAKAKKAVRQED